MYLKLFSILLLVTSNFANAEIDKQLLDRALNGDAQSQNMVGEAYLKGQNVTKDREEAGKWFEKSAQQDFPAGTYNFGLYLAITNKEPDSYQKGMALIKHAADQGFAEAQNHIANTYGMKGEFEESTKWLKKAAEQGNASALATLGIYNEEGLGVRKSNQKAIEYFKKSVELGDATAQARLAGMYAEGKGVKVDYNLAADLYKKAADQNNPDAQAGLGLLYRLGNGVEQNSNEAVKLFRLSVAQKNDSGILHLGNVYAKGDGVKQSMPLWYALVSRCGQNCNADQRIKIFIAANFITAEEMKAGEKIYREMLSKDDILSVVDEYEKTI